MRKSSKFWKLAFVFFVLGLLAQIIKIRTIQIIGIVLGLVSIYMIFFANHFRIEEDREEREAEKRYRESSNNGETLMERYARRAKDTAEKKTEREAPVNTSEYKTTSPEVPSCVDEKYIQYVMSNNPTVTRDDVIAFVSVLNIYDNTGDKAKTFKAFDSFIEQLAFANPMHAMMVNGFFCGLLGRNMSLSSEEINSLAQKYTPMIVAGLNSQSKQ